MSLTSDNKENSIDSALFLSAPDKWEEIVMAMKPGAHLLLLNSVKDHHIGTIAVEDAGLEVRDTIAYVLADGENDVGMMMVTVARKTLHGTVAENILRYGTGGLNIDKCRINPGEYIPGGGNGKANHGGNFAGEYQGERPRVKPHTSGRWPANLILQDCPAVRAMFPFTKSGKDVNPTSNSVKGFFSQSMSYYSKEANYGDEGSAARFFYSAPTLNALIGYLLKLTTPLGGTVLTSPGFPVATDEFQLIEHNG